LIFLRTTLCLEGCWPNYIQDHQQENNQNNSLKNILEHDFWLGLEHTAKSITV